MSLSEHIEIVEKTSRLHFEGKILLPDVPGMKYSSNTVQRQ